MESSKRVSFVSSISSFIVWFVIVTGATIGMIRYTSQPGPIGVSPKSWPTECSLPLPASLPTVLMFVHARCPCTRASLSELERLIATGNGQMNTFLVFTEPAGVDSNWAHSDLWRSASAMPGLKVIMDSAGVLTSKFSCVTSGTTLLYDANGTLQFSGGITPARGHEGDNSGKSALEALILHNTPQLRSTPVYGCALLDDSCAAVCQK